MPKIVDHDQRRADIAAAVLRVIARDGVRGADLRSVAKEARCSTGAIAHYAGDKQALLLGALREAMQHVARAMADIAVARDDMARLTAMLEAGMPLDAERAASCRIFYHFAAEGMNDRNLARELASYYDWWRREVADVIEALQRKGHFPGQCPSRLAETLVGLAEGLSIQAVFDTGIAEPGKLSGGDTLVARLGERLADAIARFDARSLTKGQTV